VRGRTAEPVCFADVGQCIDAKGGISQACCSNNFPFPNLDPKDADAGTKVV